jgi:putative ABC transport system substrate-binding protein
MVTCTLSLLVVSLAAEAQQATKVPRIGILLFASPELPLPRTLLGVFRQELRERGYIEGQHIALEYRWAEGRDERFPALAAELVRLDPAVIVATGTPAALAAQHATTTIPIVVTAMGNPVRDGLVASLARPGGNITGSTFLGPELVPKRLEFLKEAVPGASRVGILWHPGVYGEGTMRDMVRETEVAAQRLGVQLQLLGAEEPNDFDRAFAAMSRERVDALLVFPSPMFYREHRRIVDLATQNRLPAVYPFREAVEAGGLMAYGASLPDLYRRAATYVDKILKGAKPADLPVEQPTKFELVLNLKTAKALGITMPPSLLVFADEVLQ